MSSDLSNTPLADLTLNEAARPKAPPIPGVTEDQRNAGLHLRAIHRLHLREVSRARAVLRHIADGKQDPSALLAALEGMDMVQNFRLFGTLCGRECQMLGFHHDAEEQQVFPVLEMKGSEGLRKVVAKLRAEHLVVHELLTRLEQAARLLETDPNEAQFQHTSAIFDRLEAVVRSHFGYEETELEEALGVHIDMF